MTLASFSSGLLTAVVFLAMISVLVAAHEYGHYLFARVFGMGVEEFAIGMGKKLTVWRRKRTLVRVPEGYEHDPKQISEGAAFEGGNIVSQSKLVETTSGPMLEETTEFTVRALPIGGFVRIKGMVPQEDGSEVKIPGGFYSKPPWQRLIVLLAGPAASVVSGFLALVILFLLCGVMKPVDNQPILGPIGAGGPAAQGGLKEGDRILAAAGKPVENFYDFTQIISANGGKKISVRYQRDGKAMETSVTPKIGKMTPLGPDLQPQMPPTEHGLIGVAYRVHLVSIGVGEATQRAFQVPVDAVFGLFQMVEKPSTIKDEAGGAIMIVAATHEATQEGLTHIISLACLLSISVGIFNLLPIPPLDGGQMAMAFAELLRGGRRLSIQVQQTVMSAGVIIVIVLAIFVMFFDVQRFTGGSSPAPPPKAATSK